MFTLRRLFSQIYGYVSSGGVLIVLQSGSEDISEVIYSTLARERKVLIGNSLIG